MGAKADAAQAELDEYKKLVRTVSIETAKERGWCDPGLNQVLRDLELPEKLNLRVLVTVTYTAQKFVTITDAADMDEARAKVSAMETSEVAGMLETLRGHNVIGIEVAPPPPETEAGERNPVMDMVTVGTDRRDFPDGMYVQGRRERCYIQSRLGYVCTRPHHTDPRHIAANMDAVIDVWDAGSPEDTGLRRTW